MEQTLESIMHCPNVDVNNISEVILEGCHGADGSAGLTNPMQV